MDMIAMLSGLGAATDGGVSSSTSPPPVPPTPVPPIDAFYAEVGLTPEQIARTANVSYTTKEDVTTYVKQWLASAKAGQLVTALQKLDKVDAPPSEGLRTVGILNLLARIGLITGALMKKPDGTPDRAAIQQFIQALDAAYLKRLELRHPRQYKAVLDYLNAADKQAKTDAALRVGAAATAVIRARTTKKSETQRVLIGKKFESFTSPSDALPSTGEEPIAWALAWRLVSPLAASRMEVAIDRANLDARLGDVDELMAKARANMAAAQARYTRAKTAYDAAYAEWQKAAAAAAAQPAVSPDASQTAKDADATRRALEAAKLAAAELTRQMDEKVAEYNRAVSAAAQAELEATRAAKKAADAQASGDAARIKAVEKELAAATEKATAAEAKVKELAAAQSDTIATLKSAVAEAQKEAAAAMKATLESAAKDGSTEAAMLAEKAKALALEATQVAGQTLESVGEQVVITPASDVKKKLPVAAIALGAVAIGGFLWWRSRQASRV